MSIASLVNDDKTEYKRCAIVKREIKKLHQESWDRCVSNLEYDVHGAHLNVYKIMKYLNKAEKDNAEINNISEKDWLKYYKSLWFNTKEVMNNSPRKRYVCTNPIIFEEMN
jgi:hypothetical protein